MAAAPRWRKSSLTDDLIRPALELAWMVARADPDSAPSTLRPVLGFTKLPRSALAQVRRAVEDTPEFRETVAAALDEDDAGFTRAAWLWLHRPAGWEDELTALAAEAEASTNAAHEDKAERSAAKRLAKVEAAARRTQQAADRALREAAEATAAIDLERRARRRTEEEVERLRDRMVGLESERDRAAARAREAEATVGELRRERSRLRDRVADLERQAAAVIDREALSGAVREAASSLARAAELLQAPPPERPVRRRPAPRREPAPLPGGLFDDMPEAAEHLVKVDGMTLLVDGYNASKLAWPELPIDEQRRRLLDALAELALRSGVRPHVVFDGAAGSGAAPRGVPRPVQVTFSPEGVTADDVLLDLVEAHPQGRPVTVASSDGEVRDGARARGANTISSAQLLAVAGRYGLDP